MSVTDGAASVLIVEDERKLSEYYSESIQREYDVRTAHSGADALEQLVFDPDVVLLDRQLPDMSGGEVLEAVRERGVDARVAMLTAVEPDFDIIDADIDEYLTKPVRSGDLVGVVERLLIIDDLHERKRELSSKRVKRNVLEVEKSDEELADNDAFQRLESRIADLEAEISSLEAQLDPGPGPGQFAQ